MKLTDTQLILLSKASQRDDRAVQLPTNLKGGAAHKVVGKLLDDGLLEELPAGRTLPAWRRDDGERPVALRITRQSMKAIQINDDEGERSSATSANPAGEKTRRAKARTRGALSKKRTHGNTARSGRDGSKQATVLDMLGRTRGTTIDAITQATGWQTHSIRGFLSGVVRKKLGLKLLSEKVGDERTYRIGGGRPR